MLLRENTLVKPRIDEANAAKLPEGVLYRVTYPICNIGQLNANNRVYERDVWERVLADEDICKKMECRTLFGQAEHPVETQSDLQLTSHIVTETWMDDSTVYQKMDILDTPTGRILETLLKAGCQVGVSTRAEGDLEDYEIDEGGGEPKQCQRVVAETYRYVTTDFTADPSTFDVSPQDVERNIVQTVSGLAKEGKMTEGEKQFATSLLESVQCKECKCGGDCKVNKLVDELKEAQGDFYDDKTGWYTCQVCGRKSKDPAIMTPDNVCKKCAKRLSARECVCHIDTLKDDELLKFYEDMEESYKESGAEENLEEDKTTVERELEKRGLGQGSGPAKVDEGFEEWFEENKNSEELQDDYANAVKDVEDTGQEAPKFEEWAKERYVIMRESKVDEGLEKHVQEILDAGGINRHTWDWSGDSTLVVSDTEQAKEIMHVLDVSGEIGPTSYDEETNRVSFGEFTRESKLSEMELPTEGGVSPKVMQGNLLKDPEGKYFVVVSADNTGLQIDHADEGGVGDIPLVSWEAAKSRGFVKVAEAIKEGWREEAAKANVPPEIVDRAEHFFDTGVDSDKAVRAILDDPTYAQWFRDEFDGNEFDLQHELEELVDIRKEQGDSGDVDLDKPVREESKVDEVSFNQEKAVINFLKTADDEVLDELYRTHIDSEGTISAIEAKKRLKGLAKTDDDICMEIYRDYIEKEPDRYYHKSESKKIKESLDEDDIDAFEMYIKEIAEASNQAYEITRFAENKSIESRARSYWRGHIQGALGEDYSEYAGGSMHTMQRTLEELRDELAGETEDAEEFEESKVSEDKCPKCKRDITGLNVVKCPECQFDLGGRLRRGEDKPVREESKVDEMAVKGCTYKDKKTGDLVKVVSVGLNDKTGEATVEVNKDGVRLPMYTGKEFLAKYEIKSGPPTESKVGKIAHQIIDLKVTEAIARAELEVCTEHLSEARDAGLAGKILQRKLAEATETLRVMTAEAAYGIQSKTNENESILKVLEAKAKALAEATKKLKTTEAQLSEKTVEAEKADSTMRSLNESHQEELVTASNDAVLEGRKAVLSEYFNRVVTERKLQVDGNSRALLDDCQNLQDVDSLVERLVAIARRSALHSKPLTGIEIREAKESDPEQDYADRTVGLMFNRLG
jgi:hypothetical protein